MTRLRLLLLVAVLVPVGLIPAFPAVDAAADAATLLKASGTEAGLAVHIGTSDGALELSLAEKGRFLVHGLTLDAVAVQKARTLLQTKGQYGVATVETARSFKTLPYADNLANLVIADLDTLKKQAPSQDELIRVVCPKGVLLLKKDGAWTKTVKPRPKEMDEWTHFDYGPEGNVVSHDKLVKQPNLVQWISGVQPIKLGGNPAGFINLSGMRVANGRCFFDYSDTEDKRARHSLLAARDAFSGVPLWTVQRDAEIGFRRWQLVAAGDRVYTPTKKNGPLNALDAATGAVVATFDEAASIPNSGDEATQVRLCGDTLLLNVADTLYALDANTRKLRWKYTDDSKAPLLFPSASEAAKRVFIAVGPADAKPRARWPYTVVQAVVCLNLENGQLVWRNTEVKDKPVGQLIYDAGRLTLFCSSAIGGRDGKEGGGWVSSITVADGKLHGEGTFKAAYNDSMYNALSRDGAVYYAGQSSIFRFNPEPAKVERVSNVSYNQRCNRFTATDSLFLTGYVTYLDSDCNGTLQSAARAGCALGATPANGLLYFTPNACHCFTMFRGYLALSPEPLREPLADDERLQTGDGKPAPKPTAVVAPTGPLVADWTRQSERATTKETPPVALENGLSLVAVTHEQRVEARNAKGEVQWSFTTGGRVSQTPLVHEGIIYFGCHDGWVYALKARDGALRWRYFVAPYERKLTAYGQLESSWPVYGVVLHQGLLWASAGLHPEIGGGVYLSGLDPISGVSKVRRVLAKSPAHLKTTNGKTSGAIVPNSFLNDIPTIDGEQLKIGDFHFDPMLSDVELRTKLDTPPVKKK